MNKPVNSYQTLAAMIRAFFDAYGNGIIDSNFPNAGFEVRNSEKNIKQAMLEHYESVSKAFFDIMFPIIVRMQYEDIEKALSSVNQQFEGKNVSILDYLKFACKEEALYNALEDEYKRNFSMLLSGQFSTIPEHVEQRCQGESLSLIDDAMAINCMVRLIFSAYAAGIKEAKKTQHLDQSTLIRMLLINTQLLINDRPLSNTEGGMVEQFMEACGNEDNLNVLINAMNDMYRELASEDLNVSEDENSDPNVN